MIEAKDWLSFFVGLIIAALGVLPLLSKMNTGPSWFGLEFLPVQILAYIVAIIGFYLLIESIIEITNSNAIGWISFLIAAVFMAAGILIVLSRFNVGPSWFALPINALIYQIIFIVEGLFLMVAMFAMEI